MALRTIAALLVEPTSLFEYAIAHEVFGLDRTADGVPAFEFRACAPRRGPIALKGTAPGMTITPSHDLGGLVGADLVIVSPTIPLEDTPYPQEIIDALRAAHAAGSILMSFCSGAFVLAEAGLLDGRRATTHWMYESLLAERHPQVTVEVNELYTDAGQVITSAGTAAGIDAALHLVRRELGPAIATRIARRMVVPPHRDGGQRQFVDLPIPECRGDSLSDLLTELVGELDQEHSTASLARRAMMSERTFARRFQAETGTTALQWLIRQRVLAAQRLLEDSDLSIDQVADRVGFNSPVVLREHFRKLVGLAPSAYRQRFSATPV